MIDPELVAELRESFIDGATPSELMHRIALSHDGDRLLHFRIGDYFREAFGIPLLRHVTSDENYSPALRHAHFNRDVVPEMIQRIGEWNTVDLAGSWLEDVTVRSVVDHLRRLETSRPEELERVWEKLSEKEKTFIRRKSARIDRAWEVSKSLARLAERLQQKVVELEARLEQELAKEEAAPETTRS
jgi:hypothetical protein